MDELQIQLDYLRVAALKAKARRAGMSQRAVSSLDLLFDRQAQARNHPSRFKALLVGRRGGKTTTVNMDLADALLSEEATRSIFVAQTNDTAWDLCGGPLQLAAERYKWPFKCYQNRGLIVGPKGALLHLRGSETMRDLEKRRGPGYRRIRIDECGAIRPSYLQYMVEEVFEPMMMDSRDSTIWLSGTPNPTPTGYFHAVTTGAQPGWEVFHWTYTSNPHLDPNFVPELLKRRKWTMDNPIFVREYLAEWRTDESRLVFRFNRERNMVECLPDLHRSDRFEHVLGLDFGFGDACAWSLLAYPELYGTEVYNVLAGKRHGLVPSDFVPWIKALVDHFEPEKIVGDVNGLGKAYAMEFMKRWPDIPILPAQKAEKRAALEMTSDALHTGQLLSLEHYEMAFTDAGNRYQLVGNDDLHNQWATLIWDEERKDIAEGQDDDIADAALYAFRETPAYQNLHDPPERPTLPRHVLEDMGEIEPEPEPYLEVDDL